MSNEDKLDPCYRCGGKVCIRDFVFDSIWFMCSDCKTELILPVPFHTLDPETINKELECLIECFNSYNDKAKTDPIARAHFFNYKEYEEHQEWVLKNKELAKSNPNVIGFYLL